MSEVQGDAHPIDRLLDRLDGVHVVSQGRWRARCPAHMSGNREVLSIGEASDGTVLIKCFAGCAVTDIVRAVELELSDLFPRLAWRAHGHHQRPKRRPRVDWPALIMAAELDIVMLKLMLADIEQGSTLWPHDRAAASAAATRLYTLIQEARNG